MSDGGESAGGGLVEPGTPAPPTGLDWPSREPLPGHAIELARPRMDDAAATAAMQADPRLWLDVPTSRRTTTPTAQADDFRRFLEHWRRHGFGYWLAWQAGSGGDASERPVGIGGLRWLLWRDEWVLNVLVRLAADWQGRGVATGMLRLAVDRLDRHLDQPATVVVRTRPGNEAMAAVAQRLGAADVGTEEREVGTYRVLAMTIGGGR